MSSNKTWSYCIIGCEDAEKYTMDYFCLLLLSLTPEEAEMEPPIPDLENDYEFTKKIIHRCLQLFISFAYMNESRLAFQVLGEFIMRYGAEMPGDLKEKILLYSEWKDERNQFSNEKDREERKYHLENFRKSITNYEEGKITDTDYEIGRYIDGKYIVRPSIDHEIKDNDLNLLDVQTEFDYGLEFKIRLVNGLDANSTIIYESYDEYIINPYIVLRLEKESKMSSFYKTNLYVNDILFNGCSYIVVDIPKRKDQDYDDIESIDELVDDVYSERIELSSYEIKIEPETEFWVHCSNIQAWADYNYDTRLLHSNLAFPLLKKLTEVGDHAAKRAFKEEIVKRFKSGHEPVMEFLKKEGYLDYLDEEEREQISEVFYNKLK